MRTFLTLLAVLVLPTPSLAFDGVSQPTVLAYWHLPFDSSRVGVDSSFGFRLNTGLRQVDGISLARTHEWPAVVDFRFARGGLLGLYVGGINLAPRTRILRATGESAPGAEVDWWMVGGFVGFAVVAVRLSEKETDEGKTCVASDPPPPDC